MRGRKPRLKQAANALRKVKAPPRWMDADEAAEWKRVVPTLVERRVLTVGELATLENYCSVVAVGRKARQQLAEQGLTYVDGKGSIKRNPAAAIFSDAVNKARQLAAELGLTPSSRNKSPAIEDDNGDDGSNPLNIS